MTNEEIPDGATDFLHDGFKTVFYRRFSAFNMKLLEWFDGANWQIAGYLPWANLRPINELSDFLANEAKNTR